MSIRTLINILLAIAALSLLAFGCMAVLTTSEVHLTWPEQKCVRVIPETSGSCTEYPKRFTVVWVHDPDEPLP